MKLLYFPKFIIRFYNNIVYFPKLPCKEISYHSVDFPKFGGFDLIDPLIYVIKNREKNIIIVN